MRNHVLLYNQILNCVHVSHRVEFLSIIPTTNERENISFTFGPDGFGLNMDSGGYESQKYGNSPIPLSKAWNVTLVVSISCDPQMVSHIFLKKVKSGINYLSSALHISLRFLDWHIKKKLCVW